MSIYTLSSPIEFRVYPAPDQLEGLAELLSYGVGELVAEFWDRASGSVKFPESDLSSTASVNQHSMDDGAYVG
ncbi:hypothetical protein JCM17092_19850 [Haloplanus litoreus]|jgi:hypothetical protein